MADSGRNSTSRLEQAFARLEQAVARLESMPARTAPGQRGQGETESLRVRCAALADGARNATERLDHAIERIRALIAE